ncbi:MAG: ribosome hibernation-promoting factor, HPF/YfiA family [Bacteroidota bacterium]|jgi:putative sigma-54 modulation protein|nr:ribosome-associated translation inhibitor RaiA [Ignavibacteria bacterium]MCU7499939.1 ribosome-associated translation inhibitor RaiA [Ignavibacteria bacterium]MCU7513218.1 ribosome-associated translation inhibitor RaiA [Ignavibacteria bacterium]MCU7521452.1 ribosome-associated translation inhibitor RaiA [Ignavibacteria bacterium]MCU7525187.1 ribosome-associated translation inhibitor RaiA [Ignavibacteria bacterium]
MNIQITSRKFKAKDSLKDYIYAEVGALDRLNDGINDIEVILSFENLKDSTKIAEIILPIPGKVLTAKENSDDFKKSVSAAVTKIEKQLSKIKTKVVDGKRSDRVERAAVSEEPPVVSPEEEEEEE